MIGEVKSRPTRELYWHDMDENGGLVSGTLTIHLCHHKKCKQPVYWSAFHDPGHRIMTASGVLLKACPNRECGERLTEENIVIGPPPEETQERLF